MRPEPSRRLAIVTCMDCRIDPLAAAGLKLGEAHVIRNAGAVVSAEVRRSLVLSQRALGTEEVWLVVHTGCGVLGLDGERLLAEIEAETGARPDWDPDGFETLGGALIESTERLRTDPAINSSRIRGFILETDSGELTEVAPA